MKKDQQPATVEWTPEMEIALLLAMDKYKPVGTPNNQPKISLIYLHEGVRKHFRMIPLVQLFNKKSPMTLSPAQIWEHLATLYNLDLLDRLETKSGDSDDDGGAEEWEDPRWHETERWGLVKEQRDFVLEHDEFDELVSARPAARKTRQQQNSRKSSIADSVKSENEDGDAPPVTRRRSSKQSIASARKTKRKSQNALNNGAEDGLSVETAADDDDESASKMSEDVATDQESESANSGESDVEPRKTRSSRTATATTTKRSTSRSRRRRSTSRRSSVASTAKSVSPISAQNLAMPPPAGRSIRRDRETRRSTPASRESSPGTRTRRARRQQDGSGAATTRKRK